MFSNMFSVRPVLLAVTYHSKFLYLIMLSLLLGFIKIFKKDKRVFIKYKKYRCVRKRF